VRFAPTAAKDAQDPAKAGLSSGPLYCSIRVRRQRLCTVRLRVTVHNLTRARSQTLTCAVLAPRESDVDRSLGGHVLDKSTTFATTFARSGGDPSSWLQGPGSARQGRRPGVVMGSDDEGSGSARPGKSAASEVKAQKLEVSPQGSISTPFFGCTLAPDSRICLGPDPFGRGLQSSFKKTVGGKLNLKGVDFKGSDPATSPRQLSDSTVPLHHPGHSEHGVRAGARSRRKRRALVRLWR
jgi:hypothetical protein